MREDNSATGHNTARRPGTGLDVTGHSTSSMDGDKNICHDLAVLDATTENLVLLRAINMTVQSFM